MLSMAVSPYAVVPFLAGVYVLGRTLFHAVQKIREMHRIHFTHTLGSRDLTEVYGTWAAVTGCTSGIGEGLIKELARQGLNVVLISRSITKLNALASEIEKECGVKTKVVVADALDRESNNIIIDEIKDLDIGIFVNNVGVITETPLSYLHEVSQDTISSILQVNDGTACVLNLSVLPLMFKKGKGIIINVSSVSSYAPLPFMSIYGPSKSFLETVTHSMQEETKRTGIDILSLGTFLVQSNMTKKNSFAHNLPFIIQTPEKYAKSVLKILGTTQKSTGLFITDIAVLVLQSLNEVLFLNGSFYLFKYIKFTTKPVEK